MAKKKDHYHDPHASILLDLIHKTPKLVTQNHSMFEKARHLVAVYMAAVAQKPGVRIGDVAQFACQLRKNFKKDVMPDFITSVKGGKKFVEMKEEFLKQLAADREEGKKIVESRPSTILDKAQKLILLYVIQDNLEVFENPHPLLMGEIDLELQGQGFTLLMAKVLAFVETAKKSLMRGKLPSFVDAEDDGHFQKLLGAFSTLNHAVPPRRSNRKLTAKLPFSPARSGGPTSASARKRNATDSPPPAAPATPKKRAKKGVGGLSDKHKTLVLRQLVASDCAVLLPKARPFWRPFFDSVWQIDATISETKSRGFLKRVKLRYLTGLELPSFCPEAMKIFDQVRQIFNNNVKSDDREKTEIAVGRYVIARLKKIPELLDPQPSGDFSSLHLVQFARDVSKNCGREMAVEDIHAMVQSWIGAYHGNQLPVFIKRNKKHSKAIRKIAGGPIPLNNNDHPDDAPLFAKQESDSLPPSPNRRCDPVPNPYDDNNEDEQDPWDHSEPPPPPPGSPNEWMDMYSQGSSLFSNSSVGSSNYSLGGFTSWDDSGLSAAESDADDWDNLFNPFREMADEQAENGSGDAQPRAEDRGEQAVEADFEIMDL